MDTETSFKKMVDFLNLGSVSLKNIFKKMVDFFNVGSKIGKAPFEKMISVLGLKGSAKSKSTMQMQGTRKLPTKKSATKNHNKKASKIRHNMARTSNRINRNRCRNWKH